MPAAKKTKTSKTKVSKTTSSEDFEDQAPTQTYSSKTSSWLPGMGDNPASTNKMLRRLIIVVAVIGLAALLYYKRGWFVAASVNGSPISNFELLSRLNSQFKSQMVNQMVNEKLILDEARKQNVIVTEADISQKITEYEQNMGGTEAFNSFLEQQGQTRDSVRQQIRLQLNIEKLYQNEATVSAEEVNKFVAENKAQLIATESAAQYKEAEDVLKQQKLQDTFRTKFQQLRDSAKIEIY